MRFPGRGNRGRAGCQPGYPAPNRNGVRLAAHAQFVGSIPEKYDAHLGPLLFEYYAADLANRVAVADGGRVLETACGTGISTRALRAALPGGVEIVATDLNEAMLEFAGAKNGDLDNVRFQQADAADLPFEDSSFDALVCQFGLMFLPDKPAGMREALRVLKPGGLLAFNVWRSHAENPVVGIAHEAITSFFSEDPPTFLLLPFSYHDRGAIEALLGEAGFDEIELSEVATVAERPSARHAAIGFVEGSPIIHEIRERATVPVEEVVDAVAQALTQALGDAPLRTPLQAIVTTARRPA